MCINIHSRPVEIGKLYTLHLDIEDVKNSVYVLELLSKGSRGSMLKNVILLSNISPFPVSKYSLFMAGKLIRNEIFSTER